MGIIKNAIDFGSGFNIGASGPIDSRIRVEYLADLTTCFTSSVSPAYDTLTVSVLENHKTYRLNGTDSSKIENWELIIDSSSLESRFSSSDSQFSGTASYAEDGPFLHISGGVVENSISISGSLSHGLDTSAQGLQSHAEGGYTVTSGELSHAEGSGSCASSRGAHAEGQETLANGNYSHAEGCFVTASGWGGHAEGYRTTALERYSHAEGYESVARGYATHAEGLGTEASAQGAHAEGRDTVAEGECAHAEGKNTRAQGIGSHAEGDHTEAFGDYQLVVGRYNAVDTTGSSGRYAFVVGTGTGSYESQSGEIVPTTRQNAFAVRWDGNIDMLLGKVLNGTASYALAAPSSRESEVAERLDTGNCQLYFQDGELVIELPD